MHFFSIALTRSGDAFAVSNEAGKLGEFLNARASKFKLQNLAVWTSHTGQWTDRTVQQILSWFIFLVIFLVICLVICFFDLFLVGSSRHIDTHFGRTA